MNDAGVTLEGSFLSVEAIIPKETLIYRGWSLIDSGERLDLFRKLLEVEQNAVRAT